MTSLGIPQELAQLGRLAASLRKARRTLMDVAGQLDRLALDYDTDLNLDETLPAPIPGGGRELSQLATRLGQTVKQLGGYANQTLETLAIASERGLPSQNLPKPFTRRVEAPMLTRTGMAQLHDTLGGLEKTMRTSQNTLAGLKDDIYRLRTLAYTQGLSELDVASSLKTLHTCVRVVGDWVRNYGFRVSMSLAEGGETT